MPACRTSNLAFEHRRQGGRVRQLVRDDLHGHAHAARSGQIGDLLEAADGRRPIIVARDLSGGWGSQMHHQHIERNPLRELQRGIRFPDGRLAPLPIVHSVRVGRRPLVPASEEIRDRRMDAVERQPGFREPLFQEVDRRFVPIVEMTARGEELDGLEAVSSHLRQVVPLQTAVVIEVCGNAETHARSVDCRDDQGTADCTTTGKSFRGITAGPEGPALQGPGQQTMQSRASEICT